jgi:hypothetical protein
LFNGFAPGRAIRQNWMTTDQPVWFIVYHLFDIEHPLITPAMAKRLHRVDERLFQGECLGKAFRTAADE